MGFIFLLLYIAWFISIFYTPQMICGFTYTELFELRNNEGLDILSKFLTTFNLTDETVKQVATKYIFISIAISFAILIILVILHKSYNYHIEKIERKIKKERQEIKMNQLQINEYNRINNSNQDNLNNH